MQSSDKESVKKLLNEGVQASEKVWIGYHKKSTIHLYDGISDKFGYLM